MFAILRRLFCIAETSTEVAQDKKATKKATYNRLDRTCARAHTNQEANPSARLPQYEPQPFAENLPVDTLEPVIETPTSSPANIWLEMRRKQGLNDARAS